MLSSIRKTNERQHKYCDSYNSMINGILTNVPEVHEWQHKNRFAEVTLDSYSCEYRNFISRHIPEIFRDSYGGRSFRVVEIKRIENPELMASFVLKRCELQQKIPKMSVETKVVFHATGRDACQKIIREGFDWRLAGTKKGHKYGHGLSFTESCNFASLFTKPEDGVSHMLLCYLVKRQSMKGTPGMTVPLNGYDTTTSKKPMYNVWVKYDDFTVYPAYKIAYKKLTKSQVKLTSEIESLMETMRKFDL